MKGISLFSNIGIAELGLPKSFEVYKANEIDRNRCELFKKIHRKTEIVNADIRNKEIQKKLTEDKVDFLISTPPCQGMSTAGKMDRFDPRNHLIKYSIDLILKTKPMYVFHENVPGQDKTEIKVNKNTMKISEYIDSNLKDKYHIISKKVDMSDFGVPQSRKRSIFLLTRKDINPIWKFPDKTKKVTIKEAIGFLPTLDPFISEKEFDEHKFFHNFENKLKKALSISALHTPVAHPIRQIISMQHTPSGKTAFDNIDAYKPKNKEGKPIKGFNNTYKRMEWNKPAPTITTYNRTISSQQNVHPGRRLYKGSNVLYSDPRVLTLYELMKIMTIPEKINISSQDNTPGLRSYIGEGIPLLFIKHCFKMIIK